MTASQPASFTHSHSLTHSQSVSQSLTHSLSGHLPPCSLTHSLRTVALRTVALSDCQSAQRSAATSFVPSLLRCSFVVRRRLGDDSATTRRRLGDDSATLLVSAWRRGTAAAVAVLLLLSSFVRSSLRPFVRSSLRPFVLQSFLPSFLPSFVRCWLLRCFVRLFADLFVSSFVRSFVRSLVCLCEWRHCLRFPRRGRAVCLACVCAGGVLDAAAVFAATGCVDRLCCATEVNFGGTTCSCGRMSTCRLGSAALSLPECWRELGGSRVCAS